MDQPPDWPADCQVPLIACCIACSNRLANGASGGSCTLELQVPDCSFVCPITSARHEPRHSRADLAADQVPRSKTRPAPSRKVQLPDAVPVDGSITPAQVPPCDVPARVLALQVELGPNRITVSSAATVFLLSESSRKYMGTLDSLTFRVVLCRAPQKLRNQSSHTGSMHIDLNRRRRKQTITIPIEDRIYQRLL